MANPNKMPNTHLITSAAFVGLVAFANGNGYLQGLLIIIPVFWALTTTRFAGGGVLALYTATLARCIPESTQNFYATEHAFFFGCALLLAVTAISFLLGFLLWHPSRTIRWALIPLLIILWTLSPLGWGNPLLSAGWLFPGWGWTGLILTALLPLLLVRFPVLIFVVPMTLAHNYLMVPAPSAPANWTAQTTHYPLAAGTAKQRDTIAEYQRHRALISQLAPTAVNLYPETVGGIWNPMADTLWRSALQPGQIALLGALLTESSGTSNVLLRITPETTSILYRQRIPVPVAMWQPWNPTQHTPVSTGNPIIYPLADKTRAAVFICYETLIALPALQSLIHAPNQLISVSSVWWAPSYVKTAQKQAMQSWAQLFNISLIMAVNQ